MISLKTRGNVGMTNPNWWRGNLCQVGPPPIISHRAWKDAQSPALKSWLPSSLMPPPPPYLTFLPEEVPLCGLCPSLGFEGPEEEKTWEEHQEQMEKEMQEARRMVFHLQVSPATWRDSASLRTRTPNKSLEYINQNEWSVLKPDIENIIWQDRRNALSMFIFFMNMCFLLLHLISIQKMRQKEQKITYKHYWFFAKASLSQLAAQANILIHINVKLNKSGWWMWTHSHTPFPL